MQKLTRLFLLVFLGAALWTTAGMADTTDTFVFRTLLSPANEVPPVTGQDVSGTAIVWLHVVRDSRGNITGGTVDFRVDYRFPASATITGLHIHPAPAGVNGPVVIPAVTSAFTDETGRGTVIRQALITSSNTAAFSAFTGILSRPDQYYVNLHTTVSPGGVMRGQLAPADVLVLRGNMLPSNEVPAIPGLDAAAGASVTLYATRDSAGAITSGSANFNVQYRFPDTVNITGLHIHPGAAGVNGPVTISSGLTTMTGAAATGTLNFWSEVPSTNTAGLSTMETLFRTPDQAYINLHTSVNAGGAIRAQLQRTDTVALRAEMSPANEVPAIPGLAASGASKVTLYVTRDTSGEITSGTVIFDVSFQQFPAATEFTGLHIHSGAAGTNGPVIIGSGLTTTVSDTGTGNFFFSVNVPGTDPAGLGALRGLLASTASWYINLHTRVNPGGAIRSQESLGGEPEVRMTLEPGTYRVETSLASGQPAGVWGLIALTGDLPAGFNLGGGFSRGEAIPGFAAFLLSRASSVTLALTAQALAGEQGPSVRMRLWNLQGQQVGDAVQGTTSATTTRSLQPGFYVVDVSSLAGAGTFTLGVTSDALSVGGIAGGNIASGVTGFASFELRSRQTVSVQLFGKAFYAPFGAGNLTLTVKDRNGATLARAQ